MKRKTAVIALLAVLAFTAGYVKLTTHHQPRPGAVQVTFIAEAQWNARNTGTHAGLLNTTCNFHEWKAGVPIYCTVKGERGADAGYLTLTPTDSRYNEFTVSVVVY